MSRPIAKAFDVTLFETLTGFKYIGEKIKEFKVSGDYEFQFGYEESYGCLIGTHARDKDAVVAVMGVAELAAYYKSKGLTLYEALIALYEKYGYYLETLQSITLKGKEGVEKIAHILTTLRQDPPKEVAGMKVTATRDYKSGITKDMISGEETETGLPSSNVLYFDLEDDVWFCVRPSGTEPKVKFYFGVKGETMEMAEDRLEKLQTSVMSLVEKITA
jgi:phosphoglucomutase